MANRQSVGSVVYGPMGQNQSVGIGGLGSQGLSQAPGPNAPSLQLVEGAAQDRADKADKARRERCLEIARGMGESDSIEDLLDRAERLYRWLKEGRR